MRTEAPVALNALQVCQMKEVMHEGYLVSMQELEKVDIKDLEDVFVARDYPEVLWRIARTTP